MGTLASKPHRQPNPYARRSDAPEYSEPDPPKSSVETPPPSLAKVISRRRVAVNPGGVAVEEVVELDKSFGLSKKFSSRFEIGEEIGRGHFGYTTCSAIAKKGELKGQKVAVKIIPKFKMTTATVIEDVRREIKIFGALTGHHNIAQFYEAYEDADNVYVVMELCEGGDLLHRILTRGGKYSEDNAKKIMVQILDVVAFCHLQGVVHRDIKPENFVFSSKDENSQLKAIDFGLSNFVRPDQKLNDVVGSTYYVAPEVLNRSYGREADVWSAGVIAYVLLCGTRPFCAPTESGIIKAVLKASAGFDNDPWPSLSSESKDFVRCLLREDPKRRITAAQALCHPWLRNRTKVKLPLDIHILRHMRPYMQSSSLRRAALKALSKTLTEDELFYFKEQFALMYPDASGGITLETIKMALTSNATDAMKESHVLDSLDPLKALGYRRMYFEEMCAAALSVDQLEILDDWEQRSRSAYEMFEKDGNRAILIEELVSELGLSPSMPVHAVLQDWVRQSDGKLTLLGFVKLLQGYPTHSANSP